MKSLLILSVLASTFAQAQLLYPPVKKITQVETRFGTVIEDPYKWMENSSDPDLWSWIEEQKTLTSNHLDAVLHEDFTARVVDYRKIKADQTKLTDSSTRSSAIGPIPFDDHMERKERLIQWQSSLNFKSNIFKKESGTYKIEAKPIAGNDLTRLVITRKSNNQLVDILVVKFYTFVTWADESNFYYVSDMDERIGGGRPGLFKHTVGEIQSEDKLLLSAKNTSSLTIHQLGDAFFAQIDNTIGSLQLSTGKVTNVQTFNGDIVEMNDLPEATATILTFKNANYGEFQKLRLRDGSRAIFLGEQNFVLAKTKKLDETNTLVLGLLDGSHVAGVYDGTELKMLDLRDGTIDVGAVKDGVLKLGIETYSAPRKVYEYTIATGELKLVASQKFPIEVEAEKVPYTAANGQTASMWIMRKKGVALSSKTPTILYGYGGFRASITPLFGMYETLPWMEKGGAFVVVTLPGSLDYGQSWYDMAKVGNRINAWDSFALAGKELIKRGWTSKEHLGMLGASNGGTLVAGTLQRHSDTFKAAVPLVGVMDLLNFTLFTAGKYWTNDYGNPFNENDFHAMFPLSPYHNLERRDYPATMVMTAEFDDRVVPMHSYKYVARLQEYNTSEAPILLYNKEWGGHARASGSVRESSRYVGAYFTFFAQQLGL